jgi:hypothetical protein
MEQVNNQKGSTKTELVQLVTEIATGDRNSKGSTIIAVGATYGKVSNSKPEP